MESNEANITRELASLSHHAARLENAIRDIAREHTLLRTGARDDLESAVARARELIARRDAGH